jgi:C-terminal processing protease CtpA/Prc
MKSKNACVWFTALAVVTGPLAPQGRSQQMTGFERERALQMLDDIAHDVQKHYYDPTFHGMDWNAKVLEEKQKIKQETSLNMSLAHVAAALDSLNDSHTFFLPPSRPYHHNYGFQMEAIGNRCYIARVRPGSDAEAKGVKRGDEVLAVDGWHPEREILWKWNYRYNTLRPVSGLRLALRDPGGHESQVDVAAKFRETKRVADLTLSNGGGDIWDVIREQETQEHLMRARIEEMGDALMILKVPEFLFNQDEVDRWAGKARKHHALIIDLRGNPGGAVDTLKYLVGDIFEDEVKIADRVGRKDQKPEVAKSRGEKAFTGKVVVLVDSRSASAAELFARIVQLQKRGVVIGDRSSGSVMEARRYSYHVGSDVVVFFGASITESDLVMSDGRSLEHTGVTPDEIVLPTAADLASGRDPVLSHAAATLGVKLSPEEAGKLFPFEWPPESSQ